MYVGQAVDSQADLESSLFLFCSELSSLTEVTSNSPPIPPPRLNRSPLPDIVPTNPEDPGPFHPTVTFNVDGTAGQEDGRYFSSRIRVYYRGKWKRF